MRDRQHKDTLFTVRIDADRGHNGARPILLTFLAPGAML
jgi:hypothetical protein